MIMARNEDGTYSQVGFVKDNGGIDTEYIYDKDGDIVFEKGFTRETNGTVPLTINGIGKDLKAWSITGNTVQNDTPTPDVPIMPQGIGEKTENLFDIESWIIANGSTYTKSGNGYTFNTKQSMYSTPYYFSETDIAVSISGILENISSYNARIDFLHSGGTVSSGNVITDTNVKGENIYAAGLRFNWSTSGTVTLSNIMLNEGSAALSYEPYGYKIPIVTKSDGTEPITTPIYLPTPLYSGDVMRSDGTITRSGGTTETFTAPQIPTLNGTTVIDVDTAVKPTEMYIKYKSSK